MIAGRDYVGVGVGALVFNAEGKVFLAQRGTGAKNEQGRWEFPGGSVEFGERLKDAVKREFREEYDIEIEVGELLSVFDHILLDEQQHWISPVFFARYVSGIPRIVEPQKANAFGWFSLNALPEPLSVITEDNLRYYRSKHNPAQQ